MKKYVCFILFLLFHFSCEKDKPELDIPVLSLDKEEILFTEIGGGAVVNLKTNGPWKVDTVPDWIAIDNVAGNASTKITITAKVNNEIEQRECQIIFRGDNKDISLNIIQYAKLEKDITFSNLAFSVFEKVSFVPSSNNEERIYSFSTTHKAVNPKMRDEIFLGNFINSKLGTNGNITKYEGYTFDPINTFSSNVLAKSRTYVPSKENENEMVKYLMVNKPISYGQFRLDEKGVVYNSYRELHLLGVGNIGVSLDEVVSGNSYKEQEMRKKHGIIYSFSQTRFTIEMDIPWYFVKEKITKEDFSQSSPSYISSVIYGRIGILIVESEHTIKEVRALVKKITQGKSNALSHEETAILNEIEAYHIYFDQSNEVQKKKGKIEAIESYVNQITKELATIYPIKFTVSDYFTQGVGYITFNKVLP